MESASVHSSWLQADMELITVQVQTLQTVGHMVICKPAPGGLVGDAPPRNAHWVGHQRLGTAVHIHTAISCGPCSDKIALCADFDSIILLE